jgi:hypothetical protein
LIDQEKQMFRSSPVADIEQVDPNESTSSDLIPLSHLALDLAEPPAEGWHVYLAGRGVEVTLDDIGRMSVSRGDARQLLIEQREAEARKREVLERNEQQAIEADRVRRASIWGGVPAAAFPDGVSAASVMLTAAHDARPRRQSPLQHALANSGELAFHSLAEHDADEE